MADPAGLQGDLSEQKMAQGLETDFDPGWPRARYCRRR
jgi:hypothetical protein